MQKKMGTNTKAEASRAWKGAAEAEKKENETREKEERYWMEAEGQKSRAAKKQEEEFERIVLVSNTNRDDSVIEAHSVEEAIAKMVVADATLPPDCHPERRLKASFKCTSNHRCNLIGWVPYHLGTSITSWPAFYKIEVAYQEAVALKRQEELIREEEAAGQAEHELKAKRAAADKEKRAKKKQTKQKRNNRKSKDQQRDLKSALKLNERQPKNSADEIVSCELTSNPEQFTSEKMDTHEDASDVSNAGDDVMEPLHSDLDDEDGSFVNGDTDASERNPYMEVRSSRNSNKHTEKRSPIIDDSSSTCSTDSVPSVVSNDPYKRFSGHSNGGHTSPNRGKGHFGGMEADAAYLKPSMLYADRHRIEKREEAATIQKQVEVKNQEDAKSSSLSSALEPSSSSSRSGRKTKPPLQQPNKSPESTTTPSDHSATSLNHSQRPAAIAAKSQHSISLKPEAQKMASIQIARGTALQSSNPISRPSSTPLIPAASRTTRPTFSKLQKLPELSRSVSAAGRLGVDLYPSSPSRVPQSYRNAIIGKTSMGSTLSGLPHSASVSMSEASIPSSSQSSSFSSASMRLQTPSPPREHQTNCRPTFTFGSVKPDASLNHHEQIDNDLHQAAAISTTTIPIISSDLYELNPMNGFERLEISDNRLPEEPSLSTPLLQPPGGATVDEFPHIDIINELLEEEQSSNNLYYPHHHFHQSLGRHYTFPGDISSSDLHLLINNSGQYDQTEQYYDDDFQNIYSSCSVSPLHRLTDGHFPVMDLSPSPPASYAVGVGPMDSMVQLHWPYGRADLSTTNLASAGPDAYSYQQFSDYSSLGRGGANRFGMYQP